MDRTAVFIAWTTVANQTDAQKLATAVVEQGLAVYVQIDGPITSIYRWKEATEQTLELRLTFKGTEEQLPKLTEYVATHHPYETPEWLVVPASQVGEKYLSWANSGPSNSTL